MTEIAWDRDFLKRSRAERESVYIEKEKEMENGSILSASEALFGFAGWLTSRSKRTVMSGKDDAAVIADLVGEFCNVNKLPEPRQGWDKLLIHPSDE